MGRRSLLPFRQFGSDEESRRVREVLELFQAGQRVAREGLWLSGGRSRQREARESDEQRIGFHGNVELFSRSAVQFGDHRVPA